MSNELVQTRRHMPDDPLYQAIWSGVNRMTPSHYGDADIDAAAQKVMGRIQEIIREEVDALTGHEHNDVARDRTQPDAHPWKSRVDGRPSNPLPDPDVCRDNLAQALAAGSGGALVQAINHPPTPAEADALAWELGDILTALRDMAVDGQMPRLKTWESDRPDNLPCWSTIKARHGIDSWAEMAHLAGLEKAGHQGELESDRREYLKQYRQRRKDNGGLPLDDDAAYEHRRQAEPKGKNGNVLPTREELVAEVQRISMDKKTMPSLAQFDAARPAVWASASAQLQRHNLTWSQLAELAGLTPRQGGRPARQEA